MFVALCDLSLPPPPPPPQFMFATLRDLLLPIQYMFAALRDCVPALKWSRHQETPDVLLGQFEKEVDRYTKERVLDPLCRDIEEDLRLSTHLHLQLDDRNPFKVSLCTVEPLLKDTPVIKDTICSPNYIGTYTSNPWTKDTSLLGTLNNVPMVSLLEGFCIIVQNKTSGIRGSAWEILCVYGLILRILSHCEGPLK